MDSFFTFSLFFLLSSQSCWPQKENTDFGVWLFLLNFAPEKRGWRLRAYSEKIQGEVFSLRTIHLLVQLSFCIHLPACTQQERAIAATRGAQEARLGATNLNLTPRMSNEKIFPQSKATLYTSFMSFGFTHDSATVFFGTLQLTFPCPCCAGIWCSGATTSFWALEGKQDQICLEAPGFGVGLSCEEELKVSS